MANWTLYTWFIPFQVYPVNVHEMNHNTATDWSRKEIAGAAIYREWVGENDEEIVLHGRLFPHFFAQHARQRAMGPFMPTPSIGGGTAGDGIPVKSGLNDLDVLDNMRRLGQAHVLIRGDGWRMGWFVIDHLARGHTFLAPGGVGQQIQFDITFQRVPNPSDPNQYFPALWGPLQGGG